MMAAMALTMVASSGAMMKADYSHVIDALARIPNYYHVCMEDALLHQFILLYLTHNADADGERDPSALMRLWELLDPAQSNSESRGGHCDFTIWQWWTPPLGRGDGGRHTDSTDA